MAKRRSDVELPLHARLRDSPRHTTSMALPAAVHRRLERLAEAAGDMNASRADIVAMLIAEAKLDPDELEQRILAYRKLTVGDVIPADDQETGSDTAVLPMRRPGRPRRNAAS